MARSVSDVLRIMRLAISRRNTNDLDSNDDTLLSYINDFVSLTAPNDVKLTELWGTLTFNIDDSVEDGVYTFNDVGASSDFININGDAFISLADPPTGSLSWTPLQVFINPGEFYNYWGVENIDVLTPGMPTQVLFYGNEFVFRTIPDTEYIVNFYGYKKPGDFPDANTNLDFDYHLRYIAYGAALNYAKDYRYSDQQIASLKRDFSREKTLLLTRTHNNIKNFRGLPSF